MANTLFNVMRMAAGAALVATLALQGAAVSAQTKSQSGRDNGQYIPTIWVDPDGCEHWVMDDGAEGFMSPHTNRQGIPVCHRGNVCGVMQSDQFFATDSARLSRGAASHLRDFFVKTGAISYIIVGHTDSRASDEYNMSLSLRRANAVAQVAKSAGVGLSDVRGYGERQPVASNGTAQGMAKNRRVEIICIR
ncbi:OmpA family protein [Sulfitobacter guttiformis]|uniref:Outer membrane protein OmpA-like peptidoglycan-associated protein n=1 Tax=Sulfitobacter guttiformis TaxID=74349 RepID=A0A420DPY6_9RHOB|nr:OmpA family protein [Sulfitobacter guttiformis]KIN73592.1 OmpA family protein [Sulfitobacter guttiformis KCTC 32187]RKE96240.1 outer membrane protein OmpA-like peptidoglycan-associated protein [Sulfitobacter guttiformis]